MTPLRGYASLEDPALVALVVEGDGTALEAVYQRYGPVSYALARRILADEQLAGDVVKDVFLTIWDNPGAIRGALPAWLLALTHHKAVDAVRRAENLCKRRTSGDSLEFAAPVGAGDEETWSALRRDGVRAALQGLPSAEREALALAYFGGYTQREIAKLTDAPLGTVKTRILAGMRRLRALLDDSVGSPR